MRGVEDFAFVKLEKAGGTLGNLRLAFFAGGYNEVPRLQIGAGRTPTQGVFELLKDFGGDFFAGIERFGAVAPLHDFADVHKDS